MDGTLQVFDRVLSFVGISIFAKGNWHSKGWMIIQIFNFFLGFLTFIFSSGFVISNMSDLLLCIQGASVWTTGVIMCISLAICLIHKKDFEKFVEEMAFRDPALSMPIVQFALKCDKQEGKIKELKTIVEDSHSQLFDMTRILLLTYVASVWFCVTLYISGPIYQMIVSVDESQRSLAFDMWFPWSLDNMAVYIPSFVFHAYAAYMCCIVYPGLQSTIILLVGQTIRQLKIITFILLNLQYIVLEINGGKDKNWQLASTTLLSQCIQHYIKVKGFSNRLIRICQPFYLTLILVATMLVCVCSVKIAVSDKFSVDIVKYYVHELCFILVVFMFCYLGQQVENQCEYLERVVLESWYIYDKKHIKHVLIFKMALDQRMPIYIFGTITLSLPTFTWFIKNGMSFFTLVMSVLERRN
ncbi:odorant receptor 47a-like [Leptidea sinapis]|uniref:odorant receptor 47a-like n=1 Tax=Leptidea sinapis TaxID=189913 RepID=UPI0021C33656|nr:odorant receptor 47a-like [Leptidea sinapis]